MYTFSCLELFAFCRFLNYVSAWTTKKLCFCYTHAPTPTPTPPTHTHPPPYTYSPENDYWYVTTQPRTLQYALSCQTEDVMWLGTIQPRTSPFTINRGHALNSIFASFSSSYTPTNRWPSAVWRWLSMHPHTPPHTKDVAKILPLLQYTVFFMQQHYTYNILPVRDLMFSI